MSSTVYNFGAGPAMLPIPVMKQIQEEFLDYKGMGVSVIEISHRTKDFMDILEENDQLFRELTNLPSNYHVLYSHGGAQMQFAAIPLNFMGLNATNRCAYFETGNFATIAGEEAANYGESVCVASSKATKYDRIPEFSIDEIPESSYIQLTSNNTIVGTRWNEFPEVPNTPLIIDATSDILSRELDYSKFGVVFAGTQKNLGPSGIALVVVRDDLLGKAKKETPKLLNYQVYAENKSMKNTPNTFAIYTINLVLKWLKAEGGVAAIEKRNNQKAKILYDLIDASSFYRGHVQVKDRSMMNATFNLPTPELATEFLGGASENGLYALKGHRALGGCRASIYNAMPIEGVQALADFMQEFEKKLG